MTSPWTSLLTDSPLPDLDLSRTSAVVPLPSLGVITLAGPDSMKFLQGQTTTDFREVEKGRVLPGAICSPKGHVLFSFIAVPSGTDVALVLPADQVEAALAHLGKYAVFSKTTLRDASADTAVLGVAGPDTEQLLLQLETGSCSPEAPAAAAPDYRLVRLHTDGRCLVMLGETTLRQRWPALQDKVAVAGENAWWAADIRAGFATVFAATRDLFQPQELNLHVLEAVSYNKGCYTGQEVVARLYFRGKLKQRLYRLESTGRIDDHTHGIYAGAEQVGGVVMAAHEGPEATALLAIVKNAAARAGQLTLGENGPALRVMPLPYELPADKED